MLDIKLFFDVIDLNVSLESFLPVLLPVPFEFLINVTVLTNVLDFR